MAPDGSKPGNSMSVASGDFNNYSVLMEGRDRDSSSSSSPTTSKNTPLHYDPVSKGASHNLSKQGSTNSSFAASVSFSQAAVLNKPNIEPTDRSFGGESGGISQWRTFMKRGTSNPGSGVATNVSSDNSSGMYRGSSANIRGSSLSGTNNITSEIGVHSRHFRSDRSVSKHNNQQQGSSGHEMNHQQGRHHHYTQSTGKQGNQFGSSTGNSSTHRHFNKNLPMTPDVTLEFYDFPATLRTTDLHRFIHKVNGVDGRYRFKWQNDTSCWVVLDTPEFAKIVLATLAAEAENNTTEELTIQVRSFDPANVQAITVNEGETGLVEGVSTLNLIDEHQKQSD